MIDRYAPNKLFAALREISVDSSEQQWAALFELTDAACQVAFGANGNSKGEALTDVHSTLYTLYVQRNAVPWDAGWKNVDDSRFVRVREKIESAWSAEEARRFGALLRDMPPAEAFPDWAQGVCQSHGSNVTHPLFTFLCKDATKDQLREFLFQETPFDIHFGDLLAMMLPGVYGDAKAELSKNFWDEMGHGQPLSMHRELRLQMTRKLGIKDDLYMNAELFCMEELQLANMYFQSTTNRALLPQAIGMMLATELMVPGRLDQQIMGWRRVGMPEADMTYLLEHVVVDVEHAHGWMNNVVIPLLAKHPRFMNELALGMFRRLEYAGAVCDCMLRYLPGIESVQQAA